MLWDEDGKETFTVVFYAVYVDEEVRVDVRLHFDTVDDEAGLSGAVRTMNKDIAATREQGSELESLGIFFFPPISEFGFV